MPDDNVSAKSVFDHAVDIENSSDRVAYLEEACLGRPELREKVDALLRAHDLAGSYLENGPEDLELTAAIITERSGSVIGPYKLLQQIGEGGFGVVYMAEQTEPIRRKVALKIIKPGMDTREVIARFEAERQALALMDHPNIAKVLDGGTTDTGRPYFVMELVRGVSLTEYCDANKLDAKQRLLLFVAVCNAIQHAHQKGVIHRDLKPSNVLVTLHDGKPVPKVIDFGVAKAITHELTARTLFTAYGQMIGTPQYMSPEQAEMSGLDIDTRSDIYSLGVLLYELLTGTTPLEAKSLRGIAYSELQRRIREDEAIRPSMRLSSLGAQSAVVAAQRGVDIKKLATMLKGELDWIVMKALDKSRDRRYSSASGLAKDIERFLNYEPVEACPPSLTYAFAKFAKRNARLLYALAAVAAILVCATLVSGWQAFRAVRAEAAAIAEADVSKAVLTFLQDDVLGSANLFKEPNRQLTVREVLDNASRRITATSETLPPHVEAAIRKTLATCYLSMDEYAMALPHALRNYELHKASTSPNDAQRIESASLLARAYMYTDMDGTKAEPLAQEAVSAAQTALRPDDLVRLRVEAEFPYLPVSEGSADFLSHSRSVEQRLLSIEERLTPHLEDDREYQSLAINVFQQLSRHCDSRGDFDASHKYVESALKLAEDAYGSDHPHTLACRSALGDHLIALGRHAEAEPVFRQALLAKRKLYGKLVTSALVDLSGLGSIYQRLGRMSEALDCLVEPALERDPNFESGFAAIWAATACQALGDTTRHKQLCDQLLEYVPTEDRVAAIVALVLVLDPDMERETLSRVNQLLTRAAEGEQVSWNKMVRGIAAYRNGEYDHAQRLLAEASTPYSSEENLADAFRSMSLFRLNQVEDAHDLLMKVVYRTGFSSFETFPRYLDLNDLRLYDWLALKEAFALLQPRPPTNEEMVTEIIRYWDEYASAQEENQSFSPWQERVGRRLWLGRLDEHLQLCRERLTQVKESRVPYELDRAAKTYLIRPDAAKHPELLSQASIAAQRSLELAESDDPNKVWFVTCVGIARYREGNWTAAEKLLSNNLGFLNPIRTLSLLFRAMARHRLGKIDDAKQDFAAAAGTIMIPPEDRVGEGSYLGNDGLNCLMAYKEAKQVLNDPLASNSAKEPEASGAVGKETSGP
jgi:serine/threonine protein kinase/tetratricopeptide (TPR) repeat protein